MDYVAIDFEASCLPRHGRSFPIEVGIADAMGTRSWLIKPHPQWRDWDWTDEAYGLHNIPRDTLEAQGLDPATVLTELTRAIAGRLVIADSLIDSYWWDTLAAAAAQPVPSPIVYVGRIFDELGASTRQILAAQAQTDQLRQARHRAGDDARWLWTLVATVQAMRAEPETPSARPGRTLPCPPIATPRLAGMAR